MAADAAGGTFDSLSEPGTLPELGSSGVVPVAIRTGARHIRGVRRHGHRAGDGNDAAVRGGRAVGAARAPAGGDHYRGGQARRVVPAACGRDGTDPGAGLGDRARTGTDRWPVGALALTDGRCWESLNRGDLAAFTRQAKVCAELHEFGVCAGLLEEA